MAQTISSVAGLLWPLIVVAVLVIVWRPLQRVVRSAEYREWTLEVGGQKLTMKQLSEQQNLMISDLQKQVGALSRAVTDLAADRARATAPLQPGDHAEPEFASQSAWAAGAPAAAAPANTVLWVDDQPQNVALLIEELQNNGVKVDLARSTGEGLGLLNRRRYGTVISDMGRSEDGREMGDAGLRLLEAVRQIDSSTPFLIYTSRGGYVRYREQALAKGATAITSSPTDVSRYLQSLGLI